MDYSTLSDYGVNQAVAILLGHENSDTGGYHKPALQILELPEGQQMVDYCNNASDAWPIITDNKINIEWFTDNERVLAANDERCIIHQSTNPLRAAMIVYIKMNER